MNAANLQKLLASLPAVGVLGNPMQPDEQILGGPPHPDFDRASAEELAQMDPAYEGTGNQQGRSQNQFGTTQIIPPQSAGVFTSAVQWSKVVSVPETANGGDWTITIQPTRVPNRTYPANDPNGLLYFRIWYSQGGVKYVSQPQIIDSVTPSRYHVTGRNVEVDVCWSSVTAASPAALSVSASVCEGGNADAAIDLYAGRWSLFASGQSSGTVAVVPGKLMAYEVSLQTMSSDAQLFLVFVDNAAGVAAGVKTIWWSPPMTAANAWFSFAEEDDERIPFNTNLQWALSSTPDVYTAPAGTTPGAAVKVKAGN